MMNRPPEPAPEVGAILEQLRAAVRAGRLARGVAEQDGYERDLRRALDEIELHRVVSAHWPLTASSIWGRALNVVHKLVRRYLRWYINPIVEQQNAYNDAMARSLRLLSEAYLELAEQLAEARGGPGSPATQRTQGTQTVEQNSAPGSPQPAVAAATSVAETAADAQALVRARAAAEPAARFFDLELREQAARLRERPPVSAHWPLTGATVAERAVALHNRALRQYLRWYINPIVEQQNAANDALAAALAAMAELDEQRRAQVAALRASTRSGAPATRPSARD